MLNSLLPNYLCLHLKFLSNGHEPFRSRINCNIPLYHEHESLKHSVSLKHSSITVLMNGIKLNQRSRS